MHSFRGVRTAQKSRYGLHLMHSFRGVLTAPFSRYGLHSFRGVLTSFNAVVRIPYSTDFGTVFQADFGRKIEVNAGIVFEIKQGTKIEAVQLYRLLVFFCTVFKALLGTFSKILR